MTHLRERFASRLLSAYQATAVTVPVPTVLHERHAGAFGDAAEIVE